MNITLKRLLAVSILMNIILIGTIAGHAYRKHASDRPARAQHHHVERITEILDGSSLPENIREELKLSLHGLEFKPRKRRNNFEREIEDTLTAEIFDEEAFRDKVMQKKRHFSRQREASLNIVIDLAKHLNQAEREQLSAIIKPPRRR